MVETASLNAEALAAYCRERGLYPEQIVAWRAACERANDWAQETAAAPAAERPHGDHLDWRLR